MDTRRALSLALQARVPTLLWGPPGVGKTAIVEAIAREYGLEVIAPTVRAPEDIVLPVQRDGGVEVVPVGDFVRAASGRPVVVFLDEITTLSPAVQAAVLRFFDSGRIGGVRIPPTVWRVAAANPPDQAAGGWDLAAPTANRLLHLQYQVQPSAWADGFTDYWGAPPVLPGIDADQWARSRALVAAFIRVRPHLLLRVPAEESQAGRAWPSPRSWDMASRVLAVAEAEGEPLDEAAVLAAGCIGGGAMLEFVAWRRALDLPDPEDLLAHPESVRLPERGDQVYALLGSVVAAATREPVEHARLAAAWRVVDRVRELGAADMAAVGAAPLARACQRAGYVAKEAAHFAPLLAKAGVR